MTFPNPIPAHGTLEDYGLALRKAADEAAGRVLPPACADVSPSRSVPLARLRTDVIDLYQVHWPDLQTPLEETARALEDLLQQGEDQGDRREQFLTATDGEFSGCRDA